MYTLAIFIDGGYTDSIQRKANLRFDYEKFSQAILDSMSARIANQLDLLRTYYYNCPPYQSKKPTKNERIRYSKARSFYNELEDLPRYVVRLGVLKYRGNSKSGKPIYQQKQVDLMLGLDFALLSAKRSITHAAVVTGDSDMVPAFSVARMEGISVWLFTSELQSSAQELHRAADERITIDSSFLQKVRRN